MMKKLFSVEGDCQVVAKWLSSGCLVVVNNRVLTPALSAKNIFECMYAPEYVPAIQCLAGVVVHYFFDTILQQNMYILKLSMTASKRWASLKRSR